MINLYVESVNSFLRDRLVKTCGAGADHTHYSMYVSSYVTYIADMCFTTDQAQCALRDAGGLACTEWAVAVKE